MGPVFDPYYNWLGIPAAEQPPNHYRLLGLVPLESNPNVIEHAADRVMIHIRTFAAGPHGADSQRLLNEVAAARMTLLNAAKKARYDAELQARLGPIAQGAPASGGARLPPMPRAGANLPKAAALPAMPVQVPVPIQAVPSGTPIAVVVDEPVVAVSRAAAKPVEAASAAPRKAAAPRNPNEVTNPQAAAIINVVKIVMGSLGGLSMAILLVWVVFGIDALGLFGKPDGDKIAQNQPDKKKPTPQPEDPVDPVPPIGKNKTPTVITPKPADPTDPASPFQPVVDPTDPATSPPGSEPSTAPAEAPETPTSPATKSKKKPKSKPKIKVPTPAVEDPATPTTDPATPADPPAPSTPTVATPAPVQPARHPMPPKEAQDAKFAEFKVLYSKEFEEAERPPARDKFPDFLISKADAIKADPVTKFTLLREAYTRFIAAKDFGPAVEIVDRLEQEYQVDEMAMRTHTLTKASTAGRQTAAERQALALCAADLAELALRRQQMTEALALARMADNLSRALQNKAFRDRTIRLKEEIEKAHGEWAPVLKARQTLATNPSDPAAALVDGRYRCLVAGDWTSGLPVLAKGGSDPLALAAQLDVAGASDSKAAAAIADSWFDLAKSDEKLKPLYARALRWYRQAVADSTGADQVPWLSRIELIEGLQLPDRYYAAVPQAGQTEPLPTFASMYFRNVEFNSINCLARVDPLILKASPWSAYSPTTIYTKPGRQYAKLPTNVGNLPREYQVGVRVGEYYSGQDGPFAVGMVGPRGPFTVVVDEPLGTEFGTYIAMSGKSLDQNPTLVRSPRKRLEFGEETVLVQVRRTSVTVQVENQTVVQYDGDLDALASPPEWTIPKYNGLLVGANIASYRVSSWVMEPVAPAPRLGNRNEATTPPGLPNFPGP